MKLGEKAMTVLRVAAVKPINSRERWDVYEAACLKYSEKAVCKMFLSLADRDYIEYGVSARTGWLTDKGREALR